MSDASGLKALEAENARSKKLLAESLPENKITREGAAEEVVGGSPRRELARHIVSRALSERQALQRIGMGVSALRYLPTLDRNQSLAPRIVALAQRHRRHKQKRPQDAGVFVCISSFTAAVLSGAVKRKE